jgi:hypothetical protein
MEEAYSREMRESSLGDRVPLTVFLKRVWNSSTLHPSQGTAAQGFRSRGGTLACELTLNGSKVKREILIKSNT